MRLFYLFFQLSPMHRAGLLLRRQIEVVLEGVGHGQDVLLADVLDAQVRDRLLVVLYLQAAKRTNVGQQ